MSTSTWNGPPWKGGPLRTLTRLISGLVLMLSAGATAPAQDIDLDFGFSMGTAPVGDIAVDGANSVYVVGEFSGVVDIDPGARQRNLVSGDGEDLYVLKLDSKGNFVWAGAFGAKGSDIAPQLAVDDRGHVYMAGRIGYKMDFDPGPGVYELGNDCWEDVFVTRLDPDGRLAWAVCIPVTFLGSAQSIDVDHEGNVYVTGYFTGTVDFDPGEGEFILSAVPSPEIPPEEVLVNAFVLKLDRAGRFLWARSIPGASVGGALSLDAEGNAYCAGRVGASVGLGTGPAIDNSESVGDAPLYVQKLDRHGALVWAVTFGGTFEDRLSGIAVDGQGDIYTAGITMGVLDLDPSQEVYPIGADDITSTFVQKLDSNGEFKWARAVERPGREVFESLSLGVEDVDIAVDGADNLYITGGFFGTVDFDPGPAVMNLIDVQFIGSAYTQKLSSDGDFIWAKSMGLGSFGWGNGLATGSEGVIYTSGIFGGRLDLDPGSGVVELESGDELESYLVKYRPADREPADVATVLHDVLVWIEEVSGPNPGATFEALANLQPSLTDVEFRDWDTNDDALLSRAELAARVDDVYGCYASRARVIGGFQQLLGDLFLLGLTMTALLCGHTLRRHP